MNYFFWGSIILLVSTLIFYIVFTVFVYYWHEKRTTVLIVPLVYTFDFFIIAFLVVCLASLVLQYTPDIIKLFITK